jgi:phosphoglycerol transferase
MALEEQTIIEPKAESKTVTRPMAQSLLGYAAALALCLLILAWAMDLRHAHFRIPFTYQGDAMFYHLLVKGIVDHGWYLDNPSLAAPDKLDLRDAPTSDNNFYFALLKLLSLITSHYPLVLNFFFLASFPLTVVSALYVLRRLDVSWSVAIFTSLLYTFLPFHFARGQHHLFLSAYCFVPLVAMVALWICREEIQIKMKAGGAGYQPAPPAFWRDPKLIFSLILCLLIGSAGYYYAFFSCFFLLMAGALVALRRKDASALLLPTILVALIFAVTAINLLPSVTRFSDQGSVHFVRRLAGDADVYGLRIAQLILPVRWHRVEWLSDVKVDYNMRPLINENDDASLGLIGALGFLGLLWRLFFRKPEIERLTAAGANGLQNHLSLFTGAALLLGVIGGFGSLVAFFGLPQVRAYNRISIFIAFFALFAVALWLDEFARQRLDSPKRRLAFHAALGLILILAALDQISPRFRPDHQRLTDEYMSDEVFVKKIESAAPEGAMIFQLPVMSFPENPKINRMSDYDQARPYLHSRRLRWSYGAIKGREGDIWSRGVAAKPAQEMIETLAWAGFSGVYVDRFGYTDNGARIESELSGVLNSSPIISPNKRQVFFDLTAFQQKLKEQYPQEQWAARREAALQPVIAVWQTGFSDPETGQDKSWRWCGAKGVMKLINRTSRDQQVKLDMILSADNGGNVTVESRFFNERIKVDWKGQPCSKTFTLPPGESAINFSSDARRVLPPNDFRELVFRVINFELRLAQASTEEKKGQAATAQ